MRISTACSMVAELTGADAVLIVVANAGGPEPDAQVASSGYGPAGEALAGVAQDLVPAVKSAVVAATQKAAKSK